MRVRRGQHERHAPSVAKEDQLVRDGNRHEHRVADENRAVDAGEVLKTRSVGLREDDQLDDGVASAEHQPHHKKGCAVLVRLEIRFVEGRDEDFEEAMRNECEQPQQAEHAEGHQRKVSVEDSPRLQEVEPSHARRTVANLVQREDLGLLASAPNDAPRGLRQKLHFLLPLKDQKCLTCALELALFQQMPHRGFVDFSDLV
mmetsp:Transcript_117616/g.332724  ORF Transcript_117616/g.332724 Transcript_117616/m.332724 type:complete len:201 (-) Transcript_117616:880-1482(-)